MTAGTGQVPPGPPGGSDHQDLLARLVLTGLTTTSPTRLQWLLAAGEAPAVVESLRRGRLPADIGPAPPGVGPGLVRQWIADARRLDGEAIAALHRSKDIRLLSPLDQRWPLGSEPYPPALLFYQGDLDLLTVPVAVAVVGTRRCTSVGRTVAYGIGAGLAAGGCAVVSGLALGIDGAAHRGALDSEGPVIGVVGSGLDVVYPGAHRDLWDSVGAGGLLLSEAPAGTKPDRWRFPARNRLIAGLCHGLVIVESHRRGGALLTVDEAGDRGRPVFAVPGSVLSPASDGTNALLVDGAIPARGADDVLAYLGVEPAEPPPTREQPASSAGGADRRSTDQPPGGAAPDVPSAPSLPRRAGGPTGSPSDLARLILAEAATGPIHLDRLLLRSAVPPAELLAEVRSLVAAGLVVLDGSTVSLR